MFRLETVGSALTGFCCRAVACDSGVHTHDPSQAPNATSPYESTSSSQGRSVYPKTLTTLPPRLELSMDENLYLDCFDYWWKGLQLRFLLTSCGVAINSYQSMGFGLGICDLRHEARSSLGAHSIARLRSLVFDASSLPISKLAEPFSSMLLPCFYANICRWVSWCSAHAGPLQYHLLSALDGR